MLICAILTDRQLWLLRWKLMKILLVWAFRCLFSYMFFFLILLSHANSFIYCLIKWNCNLHHLPLVLHSVITYLKNLFICCLHTKTSEKLSFPWNGSKHLILYYCIFHCFEPFLRMFFSSMRIVPTYWILLIFAPYSLRN